MFEQPEPQPSADPVDLPNGRGFLDSPSNSDSSFGSNVSKPKGFYDFSQPSVAGKRIVRSRLKLEFVYELCFRIYQDEFAGSYSTFGRPGGRCKYTGESRSLPDAERPTCGNVRHAGTSHMRERPSHSPTGSAMAPRVTDSAPPVREISIQAGLGRPVGGDWNL